MRELRQTYGLTVTRVARSYGCSPSHITRVELGQNRPSRELVQFYEDQFESDGLLHSLMEVVEHHAEQERRRAGGTRMAVPQKLPGDASALVLSDTVVGDGGVVGRGDRGW
jgi:transcriptional regulator with XRE-family HTH domain